MSVKQNRAISLLGRMVAVRCVDFGTRHGLGCIKTWCFHPVFQRGPSYATSCRRTFVQYYEMSINHLDKDNFGQHVRQQHDVPGSPTHSVSQVRVVPDKLQEMMFLRIVNILNACAPSVCMYPSFLQSTCKTAGIKTTN